ncbi:MULTISPECIES: hypothetical protein [unclassified Pseudomonas]|uniref:hypothetical protein n=1 Tax=unclassified Pseudomonas TaxID=196821 RepID=UPI002114BDC8|nr:MULTISPECIES: hypothetical protein [unclassified Pseudomonas]
MTGNHVWKNRARSKTINKEFNFSKKVLVIHTVHCYRFLLLETKHFLRRMTCMEHAEIHWHTKCLGIAAQNNPHSAVFFLSRDTMTDMNDLAATATNLIYSSDSGFDVAVEDFRQDDDTGTDSSTIRAALAWISANVPDGQGSRLYFETGRTYIYDRTAEIDYINNLVIDLNGATLMRADASVTTARLATDTSVSSNTIVLDAVPDSWYVNDTVTAFVGSGDQDTSRSPMRITAIDPNTNTVTLAAGFGPFGNTTQTIPAGSWVGKSFQCFLGRPSTEEGGKLRPGINYNVQIINGSVDGNSANQLNNSWRFAMEIYINGRSSGIRGVRFANTTGECIVGHGLRVESCEFRNLSGSAFHTSRHDDTDAVGSASWFINNYVESVCLAGNQANGHSEGAVTFSWGAGRLIVTGNEFRNGNESVLGGFGPSSGEAMPDKWIIFSDNIATSFKALFWGLFPPLEGVVISNNVLVDCNDNSAQLNKLFDSETSSVGGNVAVGNTVLGGSFRATNATFGVEPTNTISQVKVWARGRKLRTDYSSLSDCTAVVEASTAIMALISADTTGSVVAFHSASGNRSGSFFIQWLPSQKKLQLLGNESGARVEFATPVAMPGQVNMTLRTFNDNTAAKAAGLVAGDLYKLASGAVFSVI